MHVSRMLVVVCLGITFVGKDSFAQSCVPPTTQAWLSISSSGEAGDTLWFGFDVLATRGIDPALCEMEIPPPPPDGVFDARFVDYTFVSPPTLGSGVLNNYLPIDVTPVPRDTFWVRFQPGDAGHPVTANWDPQSIRSICDSAWMTDEYINIFYRVRMHIDSSLVFVNPAFRGLIIYTFGGRVTSTDFQNPYQMKYALQQNYPNPFNPTTLISYELASSPPNGEARRVNNWVTLKVYNILGQEVRTLVNERKEAGGHRVQFNAEGLPSGVYIYRMQSGNNTQSRKMILLR